jgi:hypothetical protein
MRAGKEQGDALVDRRTVRAEKQSQTGHARSGNRFQDLDSNLADARP